MHWSLIHDVNSFRKDGVTIVHLFRLIWTRRILWNLLLVSKTGLYVTDILDTTLNTIWSCLLVCWLGGGGGDGGQG